MFLLFAPNDNISFPLIERKEFRGKFSEEEISKIVAEKLELVGLSGIEDKYPSIFEKEIPFYKQLLQNPEKFCNS